MRSRSRRSVSDTAKRFRFRKNDTIGNLAAPRRHFDWLCALGESHDLSPSGAIGDVVGTGLLTCSVAMSAGGAKAAGGRCRHDHHHLSCSAVGRCSQRAYLGDPGHLLDCLFYLLDRRSVRSGERAGRPGGDDDANDPHHDNEPAESDVKPGNGSKHRVPFVQTGTHREEVGARRARERSCSHVPKDLAPASSSPLPTTRAWDLGVLA